MASLGLIGCSKEAEDGDELEVDRSTSRGAPAGTFTILSERERLELEHRETVLDPHNDGWASEAFHGETQDRLKELASALEEREALGAFLAEGAPSGGGALRPRALAPVFESNGLRVLRASAGGEKNTERALPLEEELSHLAKSLYPGEAEVSVRFKQYRVSPAGPGERKSSSEVLYKAKAVGSAGERVQNATWEVDWIRSEDDQHFLISGIRMRDFEEIELEKSGVSDSEGPQAMFRDRTEDLLGSIPRAAEVIGYGANQLGSRGVFEGGRSLIGIAVGDANGDGIDDIYAPQAKDLPNLFLLSRPDGSHEEVAAVAGLDWLDVSPVALFADFDNDGDQDLVVATRLSLVIHSNDDGTGRKFSRVAEFPQGDTSSICAADYDGDGLLDLYVCNYLGGDSEQDVVTLPDAVYNGKQGGKNKLYRNTGKMMFVDVTEETGMDVDATRLSLAASWEDFDNDGDLDLYVANDFGPKALYRNDGGKFKQIAAEVGADDPSTGMSVTWGDLDRDGFMDTCIGNMFSAAGNRVTAQPMFQQKLTEGLEASRVGYLARGNTLLVNNGKGGFSERSEEAGVVNTQWTWGTLFADLDNSGGLDMYAVNGFITGPVVDDL